MTQEADYPKTTFIQFSNFGITRIKIELLVSQYNKSLKNMSFSCLHLKFCTHRVLCLKGTKWMLTCPALRILSFSVYRILALLCSRVQRPFLVNNWVWLPFSHASLKCLFLSISMNESVSYYPNPNYFKIFYFITLLREQLWLKNIDSL